jgi:transcriptional regulator with XRE-family HTH domain
MKLSEWLKNTGTTQEEFAKRLRVRQGVLTRYVTGRQTPRPLRLATITRLTGGAVTFEDFVDQLKARNRNEKNTRREDRARAAGGR